MGSWQGRLQGRLARKTRESLGSFLCAAAGGRICKGPEHLDEDLHGSPPYRIRDP